MGCFVAMGSFCSSLANLSEWVTEGRSVAENYTDHAEYEATHLGGEAAIFSHDPTIAHAARVHYRYWWVGDLAAVVTATILLFFGCFYLYEDSRDGNHWWTVSFWCGPLPPKEEKKEKPTEQTPLKLPA